MPFLGSSPQSYTNWVLSLTPTCRSQDHTLQCWPQVSLPLAGSGTVLTVMQMILIKPLPSRAALHVLYLSRRCFVAGNTEQSNLIQFPQEEGDGFPLVTKGQSGPWKLHLLGNQWESCEGNGQPSTGPVLVVLKEWL